MKRHILLKNAIRYKKRKAIKTPDNFIFDSFLGVWKNKFDNTLLVLSKDFKAQSTKKFDVETGEDHKGE